MAQAKFNQSWLPKVLFQILTPPSNQVGSEATEARIDILRKLPSPVAVLLRLLRYRSLERDLALPGEH